jgi:hypothetical protein
MTGQGIVTENRWCPLLPFRNLRARAVIACGQPPRGRHMCTWYGALPLGAMQDSPVHDPYNCARC